MSKFNPTALSYAYLNRGDLPSEPTGFYRDAGLSREEFEIARAAQIRPDQTPERFRHIEESGGRRAKTLQHVLPDPHPDFAPPNRRLYEEDWFQKNRRREDRSEPKRTSPRTNMRGR
tara:strand:- start:985 stop:1335 length:351 start_codon:yes stop_codon:yes gene_type:complete